MGHAKMNGDKLRMCHWEEKRRKKERKKKKIKSYEHSIFTHNIYEVENTLYSATE